MIRRSRKPTKEEVEAFEQSSLYISTKKNSEDMTKLLNNTMDGLKPSFEAFRNAIKPVLENIKNIKETRENRFSPEVFLSTKDLQLRELKDINKKLNSRVTQAPSEYIIIYNTKYNTLSRIVDGVELTCDLSENGKRKSFIDLLHKARTYITTEKVKEHLNCPTGDSVSALKKSINTKLQFELSLGTVKVLEGKQGSGYRINPKITIQKVK